MTKQEKEKYELIDRYINNDLSQQEREDFETKLKEDPAFAQEVEAHIQVHQLIQDEGLLNVKKKLRKIHDSEKGDGDNLWKFISGAALMAIIALSVFLYQYTLKPDKEDMQIQVPLVVVQQDTLSAEEGGESLDKVETESVLADNSEIIENNSTIQKTSDKKNMEEEIAEVIEEVQQVDSVISEVKSSASVKRNAPEEEILPVAKVDCAQTKISGNIAVTESCEDTPTGNIIVSLNSLKGGKKPYRFSITEEDYSLTSQFHSLPAGHYKVMVKDGNDCIAVLKEAEIKTKVCIKEYVFYPDRETWQLPLKTYSNAQVKIINSRTGSIVYTAAINNGYPDFWNGTDNNGLALPMGSYTFIISYDKGEIVQGAVTLMR